MRPLEALFGPPGPLSRRRFLKSTVGGTVALAGAALLPTGCADYPRRPPEARALSHKEYEIVRKLTETLFPTGGTPPVGGLEIRVPLDLDGYLASLGEDMRNQIRLLLQLFEHAPLLYLGKLTRFTEMGPADRERYVADWEESMLYHRRLAMKALKGLLAMSYYEHPEVVAALGLEPVCTQDRAPLR